MVDVMDELDEAGTWIKDAIPGADDIGEALGSVVGAIVEAVIPVIENLIPAFIESIRRGALAIREGVRGSEADIITTLTIFIFIVGAFISARGILSRGRMTGIAPPAPSVPVVGAVPL